MTFSKYLIQLGAVCGALVFTLGALYTLFPKVFSDDYLAGWSIAFYVLFSTLLFILGKRAALDANKLKFHQIILLGVAGKMTLSFVVVFIYYQLQRPQSNYFIFPFFIVYLFFTIFETYFMIQLAQVKIAADGKRI